MGEATIRHKTHPSAPHPDKTNILSPCQKTMGEGVVLNAPCREFHDCGATAERVSSAQQPLFKAQGLIRRNSTEDKSRWERIPLWWKVWESLSSHFTSERHNVPHFFVFLASVKIALFDQIQQHQVTEESSLQANDKIANNMWHAISTCRTESQEAFPQWISTRMDSAGHAVRSAKERTCSSLMTWLGFVSEGGLSACTSQGKMPVSSRLSGVYLLRPSGQGLIPRWWLLE